MCLLMSQRTCPSLTQDTAGAQIAACTMHRSGALLLEPRDGNLLDERLQRCAAVSARTGTEAREHASQAGAAELAGGPGPACGGGDGGLDDGRCDSGDDGGFGDDGWDGGAGANLFARSKCEMHCGAQTSCSSVVGAVCMLI